jgi:hypothetical protein
MALKDQKDVLIAWINGEVMQVQNSNGTWSDCCEFISIDKISVNDIFKYRIKPKEIVTTTCIGLETNSYHTHPTYTRYPNEHVHNLRLTWSEDGKTLLKAEVI